MTLLSVDVERMWDLYVMLHWLVLAPLTILVLACLLFGYVGWPAFVGLAVFLVLCLLNQFTASFIAKRREKMLLATERRAGLETELLQAVRTLKVYGWTTGLVRTRVAVLRAAEVSFQWLVLLLSGLMNLLTVLAPLTMTGLVLGCLAWWPQEGKTIDVPLVYTILAFVNAMMSPADMAAYTFRFIADGLVSFRRLRAFTQLPDLPPTPALPANCPQHAVAVLSHADLHWRGDLEPAVEDISLTLMRGELVFVVGETGAGKSCLLQSLIGRVLPRPSQHSSGDAPLGVTSNVSYTSQEPWLRNATVRQNVLFGLPYDSVVYWRCLRAAQMEADLAAFPAGDMTPIGEKGRTLSGGQQARVALARALYRAAVTGSDLVVLDDPLAAVDTRVAGGIVRDALQGLLMDPALLKATSQRSKEGPSADQSEEKNSDVEETPAVPSDESSLGRCVVVSLNSHYHLLKEASRVVILSDGKIAAVGSWASIASHPACLRLLLVQEQAEEQPATAPLMATPPRQCAVDPTDDGSLDDMLLGDAASILLRNRSGLLLRDRSGLSSISSGLVHVGSGIKPVVRMRPSVQECSHVLGTDLEDGMPQKKPCETAGVGMEGEVVVESTVSLKTHGLYLGRAFTPLKDPLTEHGETSGVSSALPQVGASVLMLVLFLLVPASRWTVDYFIGLWAEGGSFPSLASTDYVGVYFLLVVGVIVVSLAKEAGVVWVAVGASSKLHDGSFLRVLHASAPRFFDVTPLGRVLNRFTRDLDNVDLKLPLCYNNAFTGYAQTVALLITCAMATPFFLLIVPLIAWAFVSVQRSFRRTSILMKRLNAAAHSPLVSTVEETLQAGGLAVIRACKMEDNLATALEPLVDRAAHTHLYFYFLVRWFAMRLDLLSCGLTLTAAVMLVVVRSVSQDSINPKLAGMCLSYVIQLSGALQWSTRQFIEAENNLVSVERLMEFTELPLEAPLFQPLDPLPPGVPSDATPLEKHSAMQADHQANSLQVIVPACSVIDVQPALEFRHVWLKYRPHLPYVLKNVSFSVRPGERLAVVGRSGAGKSTLSLALFRLVEASGGQVLISGLDNRALGLSYLRGDQSSLSGLIDPDVAASLPSRVSLVPQEPMLFAGSIRDNLDPLHSEGPPMLPINGGLQGSILAILHRRVRRSLALDDDCPSVAALRGVLTRVGIWEALVATAQTAFARALASSQLPIQQVPRSMKATYLSMISAAKRIVARETRTVDDSPPRSDASVGSDDASIRLSDAEVLDLQCLVDAGGSNLSLGERQLICVARALLKQASVVLLDEATANVDAYTSQLVQDAVRKAILSEEGPGPAVLTIAHRLDTAADSDRVMVMGAGRVLEVGAPADLLSGRVGSGEFRRLVEDAGEEEARRVRAVLASKRRAQ